MGRLSRIRTALKILWRNRRNKPGRLVDVVFLAGLVMLACGFGWIYRPLLLIVGGLIAAVLAWQAESAVPAELSERERELIAAYRDSGGDE